MFPKKGKLFPRADGPNSAQSYSAAVAIALKAELGDTHRAVKTAMRWTGASDRTIKHWLSGRYGPSGEHLMALAHHSDHVMLAIVRLAGRDSMAAEALDIEVRQKLTELLALLDSRLKLERRNATQADIEHGRV
jgi:hypothetical protein